MSLFENLGGELGVGACPARCATRCPITGYPDQGEAADGVEDL
jgi:hypothetical protein